MPGPNTQTQEQEYTLEKDKIDTKQEKQEEEQGLPRYLSRLDLSEEQKTLILNEMCKEIEVIERQRKELNIDDIYEALDTQYEGNLEDDEDKQFNLHMDSTKNKVNQVTNFLMQAFFDGEQIFSVSPLPEFETQGGEQVCEKQEDFLDYKIDNTIPLEQECKIVFHNASLKGLCFLNLTHKIERKKRKRRETYQGNPQPVIDANTGQPVIDERTGKPAISNKGLEDFLRTYPDAPTKYPGYVKALMSGKKIDIIASYTEITYNDPYPKCILPRDLLFRTNVRNYEDLCNTKWIFERQSYTWWELKTKENKGEFYDIDKLKIIKSGQNEEQTVPDYEFEDYEIYKATGYIDLDNKDEEDIEENEGKNEIKVEIWFSRKSKVIIGSNNYPWFGVDCMYIPFNVKKKRTNIYQPGIGEDNTDLNIAEDALVNFLLEGLYMRNMITPITKPNSDASTQFLERRWTHGVPMDADPGSIDFLQKYMGNIDVGGLMSALQYIRRGSDEGVGISPGTSGRADPIDPDAPASKTIALLQQSSKNVREYIKNILPSFNKIAEILLQMYYQMSKEGIKYKPHPERVVKGSNPFTEISRADMIARTNIQSQALAFNMDKLNEKKEDIALYSLIRQEPLIARNPEAVYNLLKNIIKSWSPKWKNKFETILPSLEQFKQTQTIAAVQAVSIYVEQKLKEAQVTGQKPQFDMNELIAVVNDYLAEQATPPSKEVQKEREKKQKEMAK